MGIEYILHCNPRQIFKPVWTRKRGGGALCYVGEARPQGEEQSLEAVERYLEREHWGGFRYRYSDLKRSVEKACHCIDKPRLLKAFNADFQKTFDVDFRALGALRSVAVPLPFCEVPSVDELQSPDIPLSHRVEKECNEKACKYKSQEFTWL